MKIGILGTGLQARRRTEALQNNNEYNVVFVGSQNIERAKDFASKYSISSFGTYNDLSNDIDAVIICTTPETHLSLVMKCVELELHILCEKPLAQNLESALKMHELVQNTNIVLKCGFNHRHHPAIMRAKELIDNNSIGKLISGRAVYGFCGRPDYGNEWRSDLSKSAGGHFMELGIHLIDLTRWFFGKIKHITAEMETLFFDMGPLEDNGMAILKSESNALVSIHSSLTQWKNTFNFEITGEDGYIIIDGIGQSYGTEKLILGKRNYTAPFNDSITEYRGADKSWYLEFLEFVESIEQNRTPLGSCEDGVEAMNIVNAAYESSKNKKTININALV